MPENEQSGANKGLIAGVIGIVAIAVIAVIICVTSLGKSITGNYKIHSYIQNGEEQTQLVELMEKAGITMTLELKEDKTGKITTVGSDDTTEYEFKYDNSNFIMEEDGQTDSIEYKVNGDTITITIEGETMKFKKTK